MLHNEAKKDYGAAEAGKQSILPLAESHLSQAEHLQGACTVVHFGVAR